MSAETAPSGLRRAPSSRSCWISLPPDGLHAYICELSPLPPGIPHCQAGSPHCSLSHLHFQLPWQMCELCPDEHHCPLGAPCTFRGNSVHQRCPRPQERWGRADREPDRLISQGGGFPSAPAQRTHACTCSTDTHRWPPLCPWDACPNRRINAGTAVRAAPPRRVCGIPDGGGRASVRRLSPPGPASLCLPSQGQSSEASWSAQPASDSIAAAGFSMLIGGCYR